MAATRSVLRASAQRLVDPGEVLERVNELLCPDMPAKMFVTCLYGVLDPATGQLPLRQRRPRPALRQDRRRRRRAARERHAARPDARHAPTRRRRPCSQPGDSLLLHSDGIVEAHEPRPRDVRLPAAQAVRGRLPRRRRADRPRARRARTLHRPRRGAGGRHHAWSPCQRAPGAAHVANGARRRADAARRVRGRRAPRATSAWRSTRVADAVDGARPRRRRGSSASRPPSARRR